MVFLFIVYFIYLILYALISYAIVFHLTKYRTPGDRSRVVLILYLTLSGMVILGSLLFLRPV